MNLKTGTLVLSRKVGERVKIGKDVWVEVVQIERNQVKIAFNAPRETHIVREELLKPHQHKAVIG